MKYLVLFTLLALIGCALSINVNVDVPCTADPRNCDDAKVKTDPQCMNNCSGKRHGVCSQYGCACFAPWIGDDCSTNSTTLVDWPCTADPRKCDSAAAQETTIVDIPCTADPRNCDDAKVKAGPQCVNNCSGKRHGVCSQYGCACFAPWVGVDCSINSTTLVDLPCTADPRNCDDAKVKTEPQCMNNCSGKHHGVCSQYGCACFAPWIGDDCSTNSTTLVDWPCTADPRKCDSAAAQETTIVDIPCTADPRNCDDAKVKTEPQCVNNCSGKRHGVCSQYGCACFAPWVGVDCSINSTTLGVAHEYNSANSITATLTLTIMGALLVFLF